MTTPDSPNHPPEPAAVPRPATARGESAGGRWTFLTNHARVLLKLARDPDSRLRDVASTVRITERAAQTIVADLERAGYLTRTRVGRRNRYTIHPAGRFRHPAEAGHYIGDLVALFSHREISDLPPPRADPD